MTSLDPLLSAVPRTQPRLEELPPEVTAAIGHDDRVFLLLTAVGDLESTAPILMERILVREIRAIVEIAAQLPELIYKLFPIEQAQEIRTRLQACGTEALFLRPDSLRVERGQLIVGDPDVTN